MLRALLLLACSLATSVAEITQVGDCEVVGFCVRSPNYGNGNYPADASCTISNYRAGAPMTVSEDFEIEGPFPSCNWDYLTVNGVRYCGDTAPEGVVPDGSDIVFYADGGVQASGFEICLTPPVPEPGCFHTADRGLSYKGGVSETASGGNCFAWDFLEGGREFNYCRNPNQTHAAPWCYTDGSRSTWELCDVRRCTACVSGAGADYTGGANLATSGGECLPWAQQTLYTIDSFVQTKGYDLTLANMKNYCRNPDAPNEYASGPSEAAVGPNGAPWCYISVPNPDDDEAMHDVKEECQIPKCDAPFELQAEREGRSSRCGEEGCMFTSSTTADGPTSMAVVPGQAYNLKVELLHSTQGESCTGSNHVSITVDGQSVTSGAGCAPPSEAGLDGCAWYDCDSQIDRLNLVVTATKVTSVTLTLLSLSPSPDPNLEPQP